MFQKIRHEVLKKLISVIIRGGCIVYPRNQCHPIPSIMFVKWKRLPKNYVKYAQKPLLNITIIVLGGYTGSPKATARHSSALHRLSETSLLNFTLGLHVQKYWVHGDQNARCWHVSTRVFCCTVSLFARRILRYSRNMSLGTTKMKYCYPNCSIYFPARTRRSFLSWSTGECNTWSCRTQCVVVVFRGYKFRSFAPIFYQQLVIQIVLKEFSH
jgi:hypothetical protein